MHLPEDLWNFDDEESLRAGFAELERLQMPAAAAAAVGRKLRALGVRSVPRGRSGAKLEREVTPPQA